MASHDIVVIGASAGGVAALREVVASLPAGLPAAVFVVVHIAADARPRLHEILSRAGPLPAVLAEDRLPVQAGRIVVARPDHHLLLEHGRVVVFRGPRENRHRPAIDPLFRSAAWAYGPRVIGVVLTGMLSDGAAGLWAVKSCGGIAIVQDPADADESEMPTAALAMNRVDLRLPLAAIGGELARLVAAPPAQPAAPVPLAVRREHALDANPKANAQIAVLGPPSPFTCPGCGGALWELDDGGELRYRCHTGHRFSGDALLQGQTDVVEGGLYTALRVVQEKEATLRRLAERLPPGFTNVRADYENRAAEMARTGDVLRTLLQHGR